METNISIREQRSLDNLVAMTICKEDAKKTYSKEIAYEFIALDDRTKLILTLKNLNNML